MAVLPGLPTWQHCPLAKAIPLPVTAGGNLEGLPLKGMGMALVLRDLATPLKGRGLTVLP